MHSDSPLTLFNWFHRLRRMGDFFALKPLELRIMQSFATPSENARTQSSKLSSDPNVWLLNRIVIKGITFGMTKF